MTGILYAEGAVAEATTGHMLLTFTSGGDKFRVHLPGNVALRLRVAIIENTWKVCCVPEPPIQARPKAKRKSGLTLVAARDERQAADRQHLQQP